MTFEYIYYPTPMFTDDIDELDNFAEAIGVDYEFGYDEPFDQHYIIFSSTNRNYIEEVREQLPNTIH